MPNNKHGNKKEAESDLNSEFKMKGSGDAIHKLLSNAEEEQLPSIDNQEQTRLPIDDATRNTSSNKQSDREEDNDYHLDTLL